MNLQHSVPLTTNTAPFSGSPARMTASGVPLAMVPAGQEVHVRSIHGKPDVKRFLSNLGFAEGAAVTVISELNGNVIVSVKGTRVAISKVMATKIHTV